MNLLVSYSGLIDTDDSPKRDRNPEIDNGGPNFPPGTRIAPPEKIPGGPSRIIQALLGNGLRHHRAGRLTEAAQIYRRILALDADQADPRHLLGMIAYQAGLYGIAIEMIGEAIAINPMEPAYHSNLGTIFQTEGKLDEAAVCFERALALQPELAEAHYNLGNILHAQDKLGEAAACYERALALQPKLAEAHYNLGNTLQAQGKLTEAVAYYKQALALEPGKYEARHNLGNALQAQDKIEEAMVCYREALAIQPGYAKAHYSVGGALHAMGDLNAAIAEYRTARALQPELVEAAFAESLARLLQGEFAAGWLNYEWRWRTKDHVTPMRAYSQELWTGEKLASGRLLIWGEQGVGDEIMFAGLIPDVIRRGNSCILDCDARLKPLFARSFPGIEVVSGNVRGDDPDLCIAAHLPSGSLPGLFRATHAAFAATTSPYLIADSGERERFRVHYANAHRTRLVGLAWYTDNRATGRTRSIDLSLFAELCARPDIQWISLQYGDHDALTSQAIAAGVPLLIDRSVDQFSNIDLFAAQITALDAVITIDNSTAHLAGALGVPTMVLLPFAPDWRWLQERDGSPWYPTLRLFRQLRRGDWQSVLQRVQSAL